MRIQPRNRSSSLKRPRWGWFPANIAISDISLKTRFFGLNFCRKKYPRYLSQLKHDEGKAFEIGVFWRGASLWTPISGRWGRRPQSIYGPAGSFHTKKLCSRLFSTEVEFYWLKQRYRVFVPPFGGLRGNVHGSSMARWKARGRLPVGANWTFFASYDGWGAMSRYLSKFRCLKGGGSFWTQISGEKGRPPPTIFGTRKVESLGYRMVKKNCRKVQPPE